jgi:Tol biopolymer transport system component
MQLTMQRSQSLRPVVYLALVASLVLALAAAALFVGSQRRLPEPFGPAANGLIAFDAGTTAYVANSDGSDARPIVGDDGESYSPTFSRDGTRLAFWSATGSRAFLYVVDVDGDGPARPIAPDVPNVGRIDVAPAWTPDGRSIAFSGVAEGGSGIFLAAADGSGIARVTGSEVSAPWQPVVSPDGRWLTFRDRRPDARLMVVRPDGSDLRELVRVDTSTDAFTSLSWSADGTRIAYHRPDPASGTPVVESIGLDGTVTRLSQPGQAASDPSWSPDGRLVAYAFDEPGEGNHVAVVGSDGSGFHDLGPVGGCRMDWSPDARYLFGYTTDCFSSKLTRIPVDDPSAAIVFDLPGAIAGAPSWQRVAP